MRNVQPMLLEVHFEPNGYRLKLPLIRSQEVGHVKLELIEASYYSSRTGLHWFRSYLLDVRGEYPLWNPATGYYVTDAEPIINLRSLSYWHLFRRLTPPELKPYKKEIQRGSYAESPPGEIKELVERAVEPLEHGLYLVQWHTDGLQVYPIITSHPIILRIRARFISQQGHLFIYDLDDVFDIFPNVDKSYLMYGSAFSIFNHVIMPMNPASAFITDLYAYHYSGRYEVIIVPDVSKVKIESPDHGTKVIESNTLKNLLFIHPPPTGGD